MESSNSVSRANQSWLVHMVALLQTHMQCLLHKSGLWQWCAYMTVTQQRSSTAMVDGVDESDIIGHKQVGKCSVQENLK